MFSYRYILVILYQWNSAQPWLYSPILCAMNSVNLVTSPMPTTNCDKESSVLLNKVPASELPRIKNLVGEWSWTGKTELTEDTTLMYKDGSKFPTDSFAERRKFFQKQPEREAFVFDKDKIYQMEVG